MDSAGGDLKIGEPEDEKQDQEVLRSHQRTDRSFQRHSIRRPCASSSWQFGIVWASSVLLPAMAATSFSMPDRLCA
jgi:hypothetical protein